MYYDESVADKSDDNSSDEEYLIINQANNRQKKNPSKVRKNKKSSDEHFEDKQSSYSRGCAPARLPSHGTSWTPDEEKKFEEGIECYGKGKWVPIAKHIGTRNALQVKNHARNYFRKLELDGLQPATAMIAVKKKSKRVAKKNRNKSNHPMLAEDKNINEDPVAIAGPYF